ncbi:MAG: signal recognition particle-docking protein FtsY [Clostridia bacterium]|nr:signal recognition particle-docking protein FtsY [Clostridia bacterium]
MGLFDKLKETLSKTKESVNSKIEDVIKAFKTVDEDLYEELEEVLIMSDLGVNTSVEIIERLRIRVKEKRISDSAEVKEELRQILIEILSEGDNSLKLCGQPAVVMVIGVNGVGKTTSIGKLAYKYRRMGKKVVIAAADTFRAAAIEQLEVWAERADAEIIRQQEGSDPAAVIFDAIGAAKKRGADILLCDTAGRLHNKKNLMEELKKIYRIIDKELPDSSKEVLLVLDATTGQNAVYQAQQFKETADITGIILTKLDGTAKGGIVFAVKNEYDIPVKLIGLGEKAEDIDEFNSTEFVNAIIAPEND